MEIQSTQEVQFKEYVTFLRILDGVVYAGLANGQVFSVHDNREVVPAGSTLTGLCILNGNLCFCRQEGVWGVYDQESRAVGTIKVDFPCASCDARDGNLVIGTDLKSQDAGLLLYSSQHPIPTRSLLDSHADDVTDVRWHPTEPAVVISGSVDGTVNLYNLTEKDDDEVIYQTVNHGSSIHRVGFLSKDRFFALSHMETLAIYQVANPDENVAEPAPVEFGDLREAWGCEYVCDFVDEHFLIGSNNDETAKLVPFHNQEPQLISAYNLVGAHGSEVIRCFCFGPENTLYTGGEDGKVKVWKLPKQDSSAQEAAKPPKPSKQGKHPKSKKKGHNPY